MSGSRRVADCVLRDGTRLRTILMSPEGDGPWPGLLLRHPYNVANEELGGMIDVARLVDAGFLVALQDVRGRFASEGDFDPCDQEVDDGADAVAWLARLPECTGAVGMWGASYASDTQYSALLGGAPALRSVAPTVTPSLSALDGFRFRGGVPEIGSTLSWTHYAIAPDLIERLDAADERADAQRVWQATEARLASGDAFRAGALADRAETEWIVGYGLDMLREPLDSARHRISKIADRLDDVAVPALVVGGWFDVFLGSTLELYHRLAGRAARTGEAAPRLIVGPWSHDNMSGVIAGVDFGPSASARALWGDGDLTDVHARWFDATLRGGGAGAAASASVFVMGADRWLHLDTFPPRDVRPVEFVLGDGGALAQGAAPPGEWHLVSDPSDPVPTAGGATLLFGGYRSGPHDQAAIEARPDVLSWRTAPLEEELTVLGRVSASIRLATTGTDADLVVRLCDEYPDGRSLVIADGIRRGSAAGVDPVTGAGERRPLEPGTLYEFDVDLWATAYVFRAGHRLRVDLAPSSAPRWEVGRNVFAPVGEPVQPVVADYRIVSSAAEPSRLRLEVLPSA